MRLAVVCLALMFSATASAQTGVSREVWANASLASLNDLAINPNLLGIPTSTQVLTKFQQNPQNTAGKFVARYMARLVPPVTGNYTFWVAANQFAKVWLNTTGNFANTNYLCQMTQAVAPMTGQYTRYPEQKSSLIPLVAGQAYYMLVVQFESGDGINHMAVGWQLPNGVYERPIPAVATNGEVRLLPHSYPAESTLTANPVSIATGQSSLLTWIARNVSSCTASSDPASSQWTGSKPVTGNQSVSPTVTTIYYLNCGGLVVNAQVSVQSSAANPRYVSFTPSADHYVTRPDGSATVTRYQLSFYLTGAAAAFMNADLGKPAPGQDGQIMIDFSTLFIAWPLAIGDYQARVSAIGPTGIGLSDPSNVFTYVR